MNNLPHDVQTEYPFSSKYFSVKSPYGQYKLHYIDEGPENTPPIIMVHGNPTWSFFYRHLIKKFSLTRRVIAIDHIGCGLSDKPQQYNYNLEGHINNLDHLFNHIVDPKLNGQKFDLIVHDWGGAIGMGLALRHKEKLRRTVIMNTAAFTDEKIPKRIAICKMPIIGERLVRHFNAFAWPATFMATQRPLNKLVKKGYLLPYNNYQNRIATSRFVRDIPMKENHPSWNTLKSIEGKLSELPGDKFILWGRRDFCFSPHFYKRWCNIYPNAKKMILADAGHYLLEDEPEVTTKSIAEFLQ